MPFQFKNPWGQGGYYFPNNILGPFDSPVSYSSSQLSVTSVDGPYRISDSSKKAKSVNRNKRYYYVATVRNLTKANLKSVKWAVSYDDFDYKDSFYLFSGGTIIDGKLRVQINSAKATNKFKIFAYIGDVPGPSTFVEVFYKKNVTLFIGGAGDKEEYYGTGPTELIKKEVKDIFDLTISGEQKKDYQSEYFGYNQAYKDKITSDIIPKLPDKDHCAINIIGHSLGGWNGAHLSQILTDKGYDVHLLVTLDPVGTKVGVTLISDIYWSTPIPKKKYWINVKSDSKKFTIDNVIADAGGQWNPSKSQVDVNIGVTFTHAQVGKMFFQAYPKEKVSVDRYLDWYIDKYFEQE